MKRRQWATLAVMVAALAATTGGAVALSGDSESPVRTAAEVYSDDMSLGEISKLSQGEQGTVAPPCPSEDDVARLKKAGLPIGPCDPFPEEGRPVVLPKDGMLRPDTTSGDELCVTVTGHAPGYAVNLPCGDGVEFVRDALVDVNGEECRSVTYLPAKGAPETTETLCPSSPTSRGGATLEQQSPEHADAHDHEGDKP